MEKNAQYGIERWAKAERSYPNYTGHIDGVGYRRKEWDSQMKMTKEIEEFINLTITEHMGKSYADWKLSQSSVTEPDEIEEAYKKVIETLPAEQEEVITKYCDAIFNSGAETEEFFYRLGVRDGLKLKKLMKLILTEI